ncbi:MurR/RpiR family transcriptional regulator [Companilactobacillus metriopterae]|uniref:MurR/RpiR family transcriptional regulator n=1 Tax=Companilactobacillus metriopterae TaxID=1909267 RepID=UPI00100A32B5|nr:MurR/RpiR family transcriptional regulator [Companilactobacillus metriopterae]
MNFFEIVNSNVDSLTNNEQKLLDYVIKNMDQIKNKSIRELSSECFVSTTTFLRFVRKIGFSGYSDFITVIKYTLLNNDVNSKSEMSPFVVNQSEYREEYLKNINETIRVLDNEKLNQVANIMNKAEKIYFLAKGFSKYAAEYVEYLYTLNGFVVIFPKNFEQRKLMHLNIKSSDVVFIFNYDGEDKELIEITQNLERKFPQLNLVSVTGANNNTIQNMSDINFYLFSDEIYKNKIEMTSHVSLISIMELLLYQYNEIFDK